MDTGARLREAREARGLTLESLSRATRVQPKVLAAIERNEVGSLPPRPYGRSFVRSYASEVGLDPEATVRDFFVPFAPAEPRAAIETAAPRRARTPETRRWAWPVGAVLSYAAVGMLVIFVGRWAIIQSHGGAAAVDAPRAPAPVATSGRTDPAPTPRTTGVAVSLEAQRPAWVTAAVDGERQVYRTLQTGERVSLKGLREISIRVGDAGALRWQVNGSPAAAMGRDGEVRTVRIAPEAAERTNTDARSR